MNRLRLFALNLLFNLLNREWLMRSCPQCRRRMNLMYWGNLLSKECSACLDEQYWYPEEQQAEIQPRDDEKFWTQFGTGDEARDAVLDRLRDAAESDLDYYSDYDDDLPEYYIPPKPRVFRAKVCSYCGKSFRTSNGSVLCYDCTLADICRGEPPEEGDFNTAAIRSGTLTDAGYDWLQEDLRSVEGGRGV